MVLTRIRIPLDSRLEVILFPEEFANQLPFEGRHVFMCWARTSPRAAWVAFEVPPLAAAEARRTRTQTAAAIRCAAADAELDLSGETYAAMGARSALQVLVANAMSWGVARQEAKF